MCKLRMGELIKKTMKKKNKKVRTILFWSIVSIIFLLANILDSIFEWFNIRFGVSFEEILFTITSPLEGSDVSFLDEAVDYVLHNLMSALPVLILMVVAGIVLNSVRVKITIQVSRRPKSLSFNWIYKLVCVISVCVMLSQSVQYGVESLALDDYVSRRVQKTTIYEDYYVKPTSEVISLEGEKKNIIYVYLESMETTYASAEDGGGTRG